jgi:hypothetical protein
MAKKFPAIGFQLIWQEGSAAGPNTSEPVKKSVLVVVSPLKSGRKTAVWQFIHKLSARKVPNTIRNKEL